MNFDKLLTDHIGEFGKYQLIYLILVVTPTIFTSFSALSWTFAGATGSFECINGGILNGTADIKISIGTCSGGGSWINSTHRNLTISDDEFCNEFEWDRSIVGYTATERWKLICSRQWLKALIQSHYYVGQFFGSIIFGILGDQ
uniref:Uncharacterized protein n=1 Tax=Romanomermis culicivorax TaxID=13658 RepID=A0A915I9F3_ROMCU